jgi:hypothetical protein
LPLLSASTNTIKVQNPKLWAKKIPQLAGCMVRLSFKAESVEYNETGLEIITLNNL